MDRGNHNIDLIYQYCLLIAGDTEDYCARRLGPIHLLKYLYLADYVYALRNEGKSFTDIEWTFYNFGPWSSLAHQHIQTSMNSMGAMTHQFASDYSDDDFFRFEISDSGLLKQHEGNLPAVVTRNLKKYIKKFGSDTTELLDYVYSTEPMLEAAPGEILHFAGNTKAHSRQTKEDALKLSIEAGYSNKKKQKISKGIASLKLRLSKHTETKKLIDPAPNVEYDDVYLSGLKMLDDFETPKFIESKITVKFEHSVWKSNTRKGIYGE